MKVRRGRLEFNNVVGLKAKCDVKEWVNYINVLKATIIKNDVCATGPIIIQGNMNQSFEEVKEVDFLVPINREVQLKGDNENFFFIKKLVVEDAMRVRHTELEDNISSTELFLEAVANKQKVKLKKPFYYVYLPVYQEFVIDIWAEIEKE